jgi:hypothetical protein
MRLAANLKKSEMGDARRYARHHVQIGGAVRDGATPSYPVTVVDLSTHGCGLELTSHLSVGERVWLKLPGLENWRAEVRWSEDGRAGLSFVTPFHPAVVDRYLR